ncbi:flagellin [Rhodanobacter sp. PCA2]|uniref:flagellin N-terminal helical domain-containing protein n=1 Tax=Rhodanobacter sp. PCA2 TaxID=2006117 RepID=UPI0015E68ED8|nr:flagellin [Rhodanobacter sp. PCA2]MBA2077187.1 flagellin/flagellar hook associated protein [Rhodanobacter sp. PCA2]
MALVINTNVSSLNTQNNLSKSQSALAQATQRLSSGLKINSAADNAAGFAISQRYTTQIGGLAQASANASDAINLAQTAGSALDQVTANLQAIRDLAAQSANGTYSDDDRKTIDNEVQQRLQEVTRIANQTTFNGKKVLNGSLQSQSFQIGANVGQTVSVALAQGVKASDLGQVAEVKSGDISAIFGAGAGSLATKGSVAAGNVTGLASGVKFTIGGASVDIASATDLTDLAGKINADANFSANYVASVNGTGIQIDAKTAGADTMQVSGLTGITFGAATAGTAAGAGTAVDLKTEGLKINGKDVTFTGNEKNLQDVSDAINAAGIDGVSAAVSADGKGINFYSSSALKIEDTGGNVISAAATDGNKPGTAYNAGDTVATGGNLSTGSVGTVDGANDLISRIDVALKSVADFAAQLGAVQNRFQSTISTLSSQSTNLKASQSTIQDADFAAETAALSKAQVLQQAGISVLAQANSNPQQVLKLLQ